MKSQLLGFLAATFFLLGAIVTTFILLIIYELMVGVSQLDPWALLGIITLGPIGLILLILGIILFIINRKEN